jgi:D-serine deaminase-like pyridoxal phosphate-dependent protein
MRREEIPTPALLLDLDRFERNLARMAAHVRAAGKNIRPHAKTHRCPEIARRQIAAGALGVACAKLGEAEVMARAGIRGLLITTPVVPEAKIQRFIELIREAPDTMVVMDNAENAMSRRSRRRGRGRDHDARGRRRGDPAHGHSAGRARAGPGAADRRVALCACAVSRATPDTALM